MLDLTGHPIRQTRRDFFRTVGAGAGAVAVVPGTQSPPADSGYPNLAELRATNARKGIIPPNKTYRMMEWEFHSPPQANFNIDVEAVLKAARDAGAESLVLYSQDHWGYAFYPSDVGVRHPHLPGDFLGHEIELAHELGLSVVCYYSLHFNNQVVLSHPDWGWANEKGEQQRDRWYIVCLDSPYRQYVLGMINEISSRYEIDELFIDIFGVQLYLYMTRGKDPFCYCKYTEEAWNKEHPGDPYREGFKSHEGWDRRYAWLQKGTTIDMLDEIITSARRHRSNLRVTVSAGPESLPDAGDVMQKVSFIHSDAMISRSGISLGSILVRGWGRPDCQADVFSEQGYLDTYPGSMPRAQADALIVQNARVFFGGNAPVIAGLDTQGFSKRWFGVAKATWEDVRSVDCLLEGIQPLYSAAVLYSESSRKESTAQRRMLDFRHSVLGALETLIYAGRPVESLAEHRLTPEMLNQFEALVLPEVEVLSDAQAEMIRDWVREGGTLVASHKCGLLDEKHQARSNFPLAEVFGVDYVSEERKYAYDAEGKFKEGFTAIYLESSGHQLARRLAVSTVGLPGSFLYLKRTTAEEVMRYRLPFMVEDLGHNQWFNWGPPPPGEERGGTAVTYNKFGKGQAVYLGVAIFRGMRGRPFWIREWVPELMRELVPKPIAELRAEPQTEYVHGTFFWERSKRFILVQVLNAIELATQGEFRPVEKVELRINPSKLKAVGARMVWPKEEELRVENREGTAHLVLPNPQRYTALYLKLA